MTFDTLCEHFGTEAVRNAATWACLVADGDTAELARVGEIVMLPGATQVIRWTAEALAKGNDPSDRILTQ
jgi:hypothetical protein